ncbi:MAG: hypothetical protein ABI239_08480 [Aquihabitans sp.]
MKLRNLVRATAVLAVTVGGLQAVGSASSAAETTSLTIFNNYQYSAENIMEGTVCLDGEVVASGEFQFSDTVETTPGTHELTIFVGEATTDCEAEGGLTVEVELLDVDAQTLAYGYADEGEDLGIWQFEDDLGCTPAGDGALVFRNLGYAWDGEPAEFGYDADGAYTSFVTGLDFGEEIFGWAEAGTYASVTGSAGEQEFVPLFDDLVVDENTYQVVYSFAGADGSIGIVHSVAVPVAPCEESTTTTTEVTTTTEAAEAPAVVPAPAAPAAAVASQPAYTG